MRTGFAQPLLKWAGGKRQLLPTLRQFYPARFNRYWEPFLGSAAVFFDLHARGLLRDHTVFLTDSNPDLIACYAAVRDAPEEVIAALVHLARQHERLGEEHYYDVRDRRFNPQRRAMAGAVSYTPALAAMFIYLNRTGYNGLFRLNADGAFNVPAGRYPKPRVCDADNLRLVAAALAQPCVTLEYRRFEWVVERARDGDFLYFDPPYAPLSRTARFTSYTAEGFGPPDQRRLRDAMVKLAKHGCQVVLSNSTAPEIAALYDGDRKVMAAGLACHTVAARRSINSNAKRRGPVTEYVVTNVRQA